MRAGGSAGEAADRSRRRAEELERQLEQARRREAAFAKGAAGEAQTAAVLGTLVPEGWRRLDDRRWPSRRFANIDHLVVGPGGVFVVDSKNWTGVISVRDGVLRQNGYRREREVASAADAALAVSELVPAAHRQHVHPVLCFARDEPVTGWARDVMVASTSTLPSLLRTRPVVLDPAAVARVAATLAAALPSATGGSRLPAMGRASRQTYPAVQRPARQRGQQRRRRSRGQSGRSLLLRLAVVFAFVLLVTSGTLNTVADWAGERISERLADATQP
ncbi:MAG TPA: nuclease-related domain-containing protein [Jiangellales bacterium]|nr:nuclease-related domain-containing protein [Jiangellales bacterium]